MKLKSIRAEVTVAVLLVCGLFAAGSWAWYKVVEPGRNKKVANQAAQAAALVQVQAQTEKDKAEAVAVATAKAKEEHAKERALRDQIDRNASGFVEGAKIALQANPNPTQAEVVAIGLLESASQALGQPLTPEQRAVWVKTVAGLIAKNAEAEERVRSLTQEAATTRAALGEVKARADAADRTVSTLTKQLNEQAEQLVKTATKSADLTAKNQAWANNEQTLLGRMKALVLLAGILGLALVWLSICFRGTSATMKDAVALAEHLKSSVSNAEEAVEKWWENDDKAKHRFRKVKSQLRL